MELTREHCRVVIFYDFKAGLNQEECVQRLQLAFGDESPCHATVFRWFKEFCSVTILFRMKNTQKGHGRQSMVLVKAIKLEGKKIVTVNWYTTKCLSKILQEVNVRRLMLNRNNVSSDTAGLTAEFLKQIQINVIEHSPYSLDLAMCDFWLSFNL
ncbi:uncharacterized protein TNCV_2806541 [Trichonephila clavipes]|nr:uncharacterized protein TNCV_2806541 [Trichonephila clavipes]